jgi:carbamoyltransferase
MVTKYLGFIPQNDESKVMGLSSYGNSTFCDVFSDLVHFNRKGDFRLNLDYFDHHYRYGKARRTYSEKFVRIFGEPRMPNEPISQRHADIAFALQRLTEQIVLKLVKKAYDITQEKNFCLAGGIALNCVANSKIIEESSFKRVFIQPAAADDGTSLGAALYCYYSLCKENNNRTVLRDVFLGPSFSNDKILSIIKTFADKKMLEIELCDDVCKTGAELIHKGYIVGWFQGRMEFGPRALGNRSIVAAPVDAGTKDLINKKIKFREKFRPFAPAVMVEHASKFFQPIPSGKLAYPFMLAAVKVRPGMTERIPAVVHVDGTSRIQTVDESDNSLFWNLIKEYEKVSGIPVILNTSFNVKGEPIVCSPIDAVNTFLRSGLDYVIIGDFLLRQRGG